MRLDRGLRDSEREQLAAWLEVARHRETLLEMASLWDRADMLAELAELFPLRGGRRGVRATLGWSAVALAVPLLVVLTVLWPGRDTRFSKSYATSVGEQETIELPDHSRLLLNTDSAVRVRLSPAGRVVTMLRGEANFEVAKDPSRPFTVRATGVDFVAVGTAFVVRVDAARGLRLTVTEGRVHVQRTVSSVPQGIEAPASFSPLRADIDEVVSANSGVVIDPVTATVSPLARNDVAAATAWQQGIAVFDHTPLSQVVAEFDRYLTTPIVIVDPELADIPVSGFFRVRDIDGLAVALQRNFAIQVHRNGDAITLSANRSK